MGHEGSHVHRSESAKFVNFVWAWMVIITKLPEGFTVFQNLEDPRAKGGWVALLRSPSGSTSQGVALLPPAVSLNQEDACVQGAKLD